AGDGAKRRGTGEQAGGCGTTQPSVEAARGTHRSLHLLEGGGLLPHYATRPAGCAGRTVTPLVGTGERTRSPCFPPRRPPRRASLARSGRRGRRRSRERSSRAGTDRVRAPTGEPRGDQSR